MTKDLLVRGRLGLRRVMRQVLLLSVGQTLAPQTAPQCWSARVSTAGSPAPTPRASRKAAKQGPVERARRGGAPPTFLGL
jgi:hypothetical protein